MHIDRESNSANMQHVWHFNLNSSRQIIKKLSKQLKLKYRRKNTLYFSYKWYFFFQLLNKQKENWNFMGSIHFLSFAFLDVVIPAFKCFPSKLNSTPLASRGSVFKGVLKQKNSLQSRDLYEAYPKKRERAQSFL